MIEVAARIRKQDLPGIAACMGKVNASDVTLGGEVYAVGRVVFVTFAGRHAGEHFYDGCLRFALDAEIGPEPVEADFEVEILSRVLAEEED